jgi:hypothetical protein
MASEQTSTSDMKKAGVLKTQLPPDDMEALARRVAGLGQQDARCGGVYCEQSYDDAVAEPVAPTPQRPT